MAATDKRILHNHTATAAPAVTDDSGDGYEKGSTWTDTTNNISYVCTDATVGAAVWKAGAGYTLGASPNAYTEIGEALADGDHFLGSNASASNAAAKILATRIATYVATKNNVTSGSWAPTVASVSGDTSAGTANVGRYLRVGSIVFFSLNVDITATDVNGGVVSLTLPVASNFAAATDANGQGRDATDTWTPAVVTADATSDLIYLTIATTTAATIEYEVHGSYTVI